MEKTSDEDVEGEETWRRDPLGVRSLAQSSLPSRPRQATLSRPPSTPAPLLANKAQGIRFLGHGMVLF